MLTRRRAIVLSFLVLSSLAVACGGGDAPDVDTTVAVEPGPAPSDQAGAAAAVVVAAEEAADDAAAVVAPAEAAAEDGAAAPASAEPAADDEAAPDAGADAAVAGAPLPPPTAGPVQAEASQTARGGGRFPPLDDPRVVLPEAATWLQDDTLVLGGVQNGDARAYPVFMMTFHHVANDVLGGQPYLVSF